MTPHDTIDASPLTQRALEVSTTDAYLENEALTVPHVHRSKVTSMWHPRLNWILQSILIEAKCMILVPIGANIETSCQPYHLLLVSLHAACD